jgi:two-component system sensor histidine kinase KdpD
MATNPATEQTADALLRSISHNLRTPLTSIRGALSYLQQDPAYRGDAALPPESLRRRGVAPPDQAGPLYDETRRDLIDNAVVEAERLNRYIGNLLDIARLDAGEVRFALAPYPVDHVVGSALDALDRERSYHRIRVRVAADLPQVRVDLAWMVKALAHVLDNAIRYSPDGTPIEVRARVRRGDLEITIADRGMGIPPDDLARVFDRFYRAGRSEHATGTGVGLAICDQVMAAHGGIIQASNRKGGGTRITMRLPLLNGEARRVASGP